MEVHALMPTQTWQVLLLLAAAATGAWLAGVAIGHLVGRLARRSPVVADISRRGRTPLRALLVLAAVITVLDAVPGAGSWQAPVTRLLGLALIATIGWFVAVAVFSAADLALARYDVDVVDNRHARRVRTQISLLRRLAVVVIAILAAAAMLLTFPSARAAGASILASAGVISLVAGLAAQTSLANVFAGLQLAFTDAVGSVVRVRALVSAKDGPTLFDLRCVVRERLVGWLQREHAYGLPRLRLDGGAPSAPVAPVMSVAEHDDAALFTGSSEARERSRAFTGAR